MSRARRLAVAVPAPLRSLRARVTAIVVLACAAGLVVAGVVLLAADDHDARSSLDRDLQRRAELLGGPAVVSSVSVSTPMPANVGLLQARGGIAVRGFSARGGAANGVIRVLPPGSSIRLGPATVAIPPGAAFTAAPPGGPPPGPPTPTLAARQLRALKIALAGAGPIERQIRPGGAVGIDSTQRLLLGSGVFTREIVSGRVAKQAGDLHGQVPIPPAPGYGTIEIGGQPWRTLTVAQPNGATLQVGEQLGPTLARVASTRRLVITIGLAVLALTGLAVWMLVGLALRPLRRLRAGAERVSHTRDLDSRLAAGDGPEEVDALAQSLNAMLARLAESSAATEQALNATRRFAADTGHELRTPLTSMQANVETLLHNPELKLAERRRILADVAQEQRRLVDLLGALQTLARGDAATAIPREQVDLVEVLEQSVQAARRRHPALNLSIVGAPDGLTIQGWPEGLRVLLDNLLENAALHAGESARVEVSLDAESNEATLTVDDNGPGIPLNDRVRLFERFERGVTPTPRGSGLGLALVRQQAQLHGGDAHIEDSPLGGARLRITLHASPGEGRPGRADNAEHQQRPVPANT